MTAEPSGPHRAPTPPPGIARGRVRLGPAEAAIFETFVVPRYLSLFGELALEMLAESEEAQVAHLHCRTGYPDRGIALKLPGAHVIGVDSSPAALELARAKAATMPGMVSEYRELRRAADVAFRHRRSLTPSRFTRSPTPRNGARCWPSSRGCWLLTGRPSSRCRCAGSFQELADLLREYALKCDDAEVGARGRAGRARPPHGRDVRRRARGGRVRLRRRQPAPDDARLPERARFLRGPGRPPARSSRRRS